MVQETLSITSSNDFIPENLQSDYISQTKYLNQKSSSGLDSEDWDSFLEQVPSHCGVLYSLEWQDPFFKILIVEQKNLKESYENIISKRSLGTELLMKGFKIGPRSLPFYFTTPYYELSEILAKEFNQQSFTLQEFSEPPINSQKPIWWIHCNPTAFKLYFGSSPKNNLEKLIPLGPLGDPALAFFRFKKTFSMFKKLLPLSEFSIDEKHFGIATHPESPENKEKFAPILQLFLFGILSNELEQKLEEHFSTTTFLYLNEIASLRKFWLEIENQLLNYKNKN